MTTGTDPNNFVVVDSRIGDGYPGCREWLMAGIADIGAIDMVCTLTAGCHAVVTGNTAAGSES